MAAITFTNLLAVNPGFESVLDQTPTIGTHDATTFDIINNNPGSTNGYVFQLTGTGFTYSGTVPTDGTIDGAVVLDNAAHVIADLTGPFIGPSGVTDLPSFFSTLTTFGPIAARDALFFGSDDFDGSSSNDISMVAGAGNDLLQGGLGIDGLFGGTGNDTFIYGPNEAVATETIDGGGGTDTLLIQADNDFSGASFASIERIVFNGSARATFDQSALSFFNFGPVTIVGDGNVNAINVTLTAPAAINLRHTFQSWNTGVDTVTFVGSADDDFVAAPRVKASLDGGAGDDQVSFSLFGTTAPVIIDLSGRAPNTHCPTARPS